MRGPALLVLGATLALAGCAKPLPPERAAYAGEWRSPTMTLLITPDGSVIYRRVQGGATKSIQGPLKRFEGNDFVVGIGPVATTFKVAAAPHEENGRWRMTVDGVELTKAEASSMSMDVRDE